MVVIDPSSPGDYTVVEPVGGPVFPGGLAIDAQGRAYVATFEQGIDVVHLVMIDPQNPDHPLRVEVDGAPNVTAVGGDVTVGPDGFIYLTTVTFAPIVGGGNTTHVVAIDPDNTADPIVVVHNVTGSPRGKVVVDEYGIAYQTTSPDTLDGDETTLVTVIGAGATTL